MGRMSKLSAVADDVAGRIIYDARNVHGPIVWITGNAFMPPARAINEMEALWQDDIDHGTETFEMVWERVEQLCNDAKVFVDVPEFDNSIYAVDMARWEFIDEDDEAENLSDEYRYIGG